MLPSQGDYVLLTSFRAGAQRLGPYFQQMDLQVAPFYILVLPDLDNDKAGDVTIYETSREQFTGTIIAIGPAPWAYRNLKPGDRILYARGQAATLTASIEGKQRELRAVSLSDYRAKIIDHALQNSNSRLRRYLEWTRVRVAALAISAAFVGGFALGHFRGHETIRALRELVARKLSDTFRRGSGSQGGSGGADPQ